MNIFDLICCPVCKGTLSPKHGSLVCTAGERHHSFDIASSGYVNLLSPGKCRSSRTGDDRDMVSARCDFLSRGYYSDVSEKLGETISSLAKEHKKSFVSIVDSGCGEGFHTCNILKTVAGNGINAFAIGFDASKYGALFASKRAKRESLFLGWENEASSGPVDKTDFANVEKCRKASSAFFAAANIFELPVKDKSADFAVSMFAPVAEAENFRILKDDGYLIAIAAGKNHLYELRKILYDQVRTSSGIVKTPKGFEKVSEEVLSYKTVVKGAADIGSLFMMTPFYYRTSLEGKSRLYGLDELEITVQASFFVFKKVSEG